MSSHTHVSSSAPSSSALRNTNQGESLYDDVTTAVISPTINVRTGALRLNLRNIINSQDQSLSSRTAAMAPGLLQRSPRLGQSPRDPHLWGTGSPRNPQNLSPTSLSNRMHQKKDSKIESLTTTTMHKSLSMHSKLNAITSDNSRHTLSFAHSSSMPYIPLHSKDGFDIKTLFKKAHKNHLPARLEEYTFIAKKLAIIRDDDATLDLDKDGNLVVVPVDKRLYSFNKIIEVILQDLEALANTNVNNKLLIHLILDFKTGFEKINDSEFDDKIASLRKLYPIILKNR